MLPEAPTVSSGRIVGFDVRLAAGGTETTFVASGAVWSSYELYREEAGRRVLVDRGSVKSDTLKAVSDPAGTLGSSYHLKLLDSRLRVASLTYSPEGEGSSMVGGDPVCPL